MFKKHNLLIISHEPLTSSLKILYCIDDLKNDFNLKFLSLRKILYGEKIKYSDELSQEFIDFSNFYNFYLFLNKFNPKNTSIILDNSSTHFSVILINYLLRKFKIFHILLYNSFISDKNSFKKLSVIDKLIYYLNKNNFKKFLIRKLRNPNYEAVFLSSRSKPFFNSRKHVPINNTLYNKMYKSEFSGDYVVFIDQGFPSHPDLFQYYNYRNNNQIEFINEYNRFFDHIENTFNTSVVIAKHPKSPVSDNLFKNRKIYKNCTSELILNSRFVIAHFSLSVNVAILNYKPILIIYNSEIQSISENIFLQMKNLSKILDVDLINIDLKKYQNIDLKINKEKYDTYINDYIVLDNKRTNYEIIRDTLIESIDQ